MLAPVAASVLHVAPVAASVLAPVAASVLGIVIRNCQEFAAHAQHLGCTKIQLKLI